MAQPLNMAASCDRNEEDAQHTDKFFHYQHQHQHHQPRHVNS